ncbi:MAG: gamma carbonic anhydrase family protein [Pirellulales bacterium]|nr:gamma carbonic anhydrase family protein [Pirellulales bacterium]
MDQLRIDTEFHRERIDPSAFIAGNATVRGDVWVGALASVWFGAVIRGDTEKVRIGQRTNVQDLCVLHSDPGFACLIGDDVTIGHAAVVHGANVESGCLIGIRAVVLNGAKVGQGALLGAGALVPEGKVIPPHCLAVGTPAKVIRELTVEDRKRIQHASRHYVDAAQAYQRG